MNKIFFAVVFLLAAVNAFGQEVAIELKVFEMERIDWKERRAKFIPVSASSINRATFATPMPKPVARSLESLVSKRVHSVRFKARNGENTRIRFTSRTPDGMPSADATVFFEVTPTIFRNREMALDMKANVEVRMNGVSSLKSSVVKHQVRIVEGESIVLGGFINDGDARSIIGMPALKDNPLLNYLFSAKRSQPDEPEIVLILNPTIEQPQPQRVIARNQTPDRIDRSLYTVQVAAFEKPAAATALVEKLKKQYAAVFIEESANDRTFFRVRMGCLANWRAAAQLQHRLRMEGFEPFIAPLTQQACQGPASSD
jgi:hypothetical protein